MNKCFFSNRAFLALTLIMSLGFWTSTTAQSFPEKILLPDGFQPEGITLGTGHTAYVGSLAGGAIYQVDLRTGATNMLVQGSTPGLSFAVGLDFDERSGYLFVAGGLTGDGRVYDTRTGNIVAQLAFVDPFSGLPVWINDVFVARDAAYFTNSFAPEIWKVPLASNGEPSGPPYHLPLGGDWLQLDGPMVINANGIVATPNDHTLIVVNYSTGRLYKVNPDTGTAIEIGLEGTGPFGVLTGDGLILRGETLYVVQNFVVPPTSPGQIAVFTLSPDYSAATLTQVLSADGPFVPSTADLFGPWLYTVNARFDECVPGLCDPTGMDFFEVVQVDQ